MLKRLAAIATSIRATFMLGWGLLGVLLGIIFANGVGASSGPGGQGGPSSAWIIGALVGGAAGALIGKVQGDFAVVWIEWAAQMLAAADAGVTD